jgi:hypothetical protein
MKLKFQNSKNPGFKTFDIPLTLIHLWFITSCEICHLKFIPLSLFHMPETGIVNKETGITAGAHLG